MDNQEYNEIEFNRLLDELADGTIVEADADLLKKWLKAYPEIRATYLEMMELEACLQREFIEPAISQQSAQNNTRIPTTRWRLVGGLAAVFAISAALWLFQQGHIGDKHNKKIVTIESEEKLGIAVSTVARLTASQHARWKGEVSDIAMGTWLNPGSYALEHGQAEITFDSGASVIMSAGAIFEIIDSNKGFLHFGKVSSHVPEQAIGFQIETVSGGVCDLGTRFALDVDAKGAVDVHVMEGLVEAQRRDSSSLPYVVNENEAVRMEPNEALKSVKYTAGMITVEVDKSTANRERIPYVYYSFDRSDIQGKTLKDNGFRGDQRAFHGEIITAKKEQPTWSQTTGQFGEAIFLTGDTSYIKAKEYREITGSSPRTIAFWVKIPPQTSTRHAYSFAAWGQPKSRASRKWQVGWNANRRKYDGVLGAIRTEFGKGYVAGSTDLRDGRWHHVVSVFLGNSEAPITSQVRHYVDGKLETVSGYDDSHKQIDTSGDSKPLILGRYLDFQHPHFKGMKAWMDEFYLFEAALTPSQIDDLYRSNKVPNDDEYLPSLFIY